MEDRQGKPDFTWGASHHTPVTLVVEFLNGLVRRYVATHGWQVAYRGGVPFLVIGDGAPCTYIPLSGVLSFELTLDDGA